MRPDFSGSPDYYLYVARGYDLISTTYDGVEGSNAVGRRLRARMQGALYRTFHAGDRVVELGCGTGIEALALASRGIEVVATDPSEGMLERVREKAAEYGPSQLTTRRMAAHEIGSLAAEFGEGSFDGAYSHGGALNMDPNLGAVAAGLARLLQPAGKALFTVLNQVSLFELLFYPLVFRPRKAFRRLGNIIPIPITRHAAHKAFVVPTRFYSPRAFFRFFRDAFTLRRLEGAQIVLPPWNLSDEVDRFEAITGPIAAIEDRFAATPPFNQWGSVFMMELERT